MAEIINFQIETLNRKKTQELLGKGKDFIINLVQTSPSFFVAIDAKGKILFMNDSMLKSLGYSSEEVIGRPYLSMAMPEPYFERFYDNFEKLLNPLGTVFDENRLLTKDGRVLFVEWRVHPACRENREIDYFFGMGIDVTEKRLVEKTLQENEARYRLLAENVVDVIWIMDLDMRFNFISPSITRLLGYSVKEAMSQDLEQLLPPASIDMVKNMLAEEMTKDGSGQKDAGRIISLELKVYRKDASMLWTENKVKFLHDSNSQPIGLLGVTRDITDRKKAEKEKEIMQAQLQHAKKMESIGVLAGGIAHDFNNLLMVISGYSELLSEKLPQESPLKYEVDQIKKAVSRASSLTGQLLTFSRKKIIQPKFLSLNNVVTDIQKLLSRLIGEDIHLKSILDPRLKYVKADPVQLGQVIMNIAVNARDSMAQGGQLMIKTENVVLDKAQSQMIPESRPGTFVCLSIQDTGTGMDKAIIHRIFEPFFTTKGKGKGTGLGLSIVYGIIKQHGGWINVYSEPGEGTTFKIYLPAVFMNLPEGTTKKKSPQAIQGNKERILLVEDEKDVREFIKQALYINGYRVFEASKLQDALDIFDKEKGNFDLLFSDVVLSDGTGVQLADQLIARKPKLQVLLSSGYTEQKSQWSVISQKGYRFLQKPYELAALLSELRKALSKNNFEILHSPN